jgi:hypothetical protein
MANLSNINNKFIVTDGGNVLIGDTANYSGRLQIKDTQASNFNDGLAITRNNAAQTGYINMVGGAFNFNSPGLSYKFRNSGTQTLELNSSGNATFAGNVSVNSTSAPAKNLVVEGDASAYATMRILSNSASHGAEIELGDSTDPNYGSILQFATSAGEGGRMKFTAGTIETMNLRDGNVGIGTDSPDNKLDIALTTAAISFDTAIKVSANTDPVDYTANRGAGILFQNAEPYVAGIYGIRPTLGGWRGHLLFYTHTSASNNTFGTTFTEKMRITDEGKVGIGTSSPGSKLDIGTSSGASMQFLYDTSQTYRNNISNYWNSSTDSRMDFNIGRTANVAPVTVMSVGYGGNVGIGTIQPPSKLSLEGAFPGAGFGININNTGASGAAEVYFENDAQRTTIGLNTGDNFVVYDNTSATTRMQITPAGQIQFPRTGQPPITNALYGNIVLDSNAVTNYQRIRFDVGTTAYWGLTRLNSGNFAITGGSTWDDHAFSIQYSTRNVGVGMSLGVFPGKFNVSGNSGLTTTGVGDGIFVGPYQGNSAVGSNWSYSNAGYTYTDFCSRYNSSSSFMRFVMKASATPVYAMTIRGDGRVGIGPTSPDFALDISAVDSGVQLQIGRTNTNVGSAWMGASGSGLAVGIGAYGAGNSVTDPKGFLIDASGNLSTRRRIQAKTDTGVGVAVTRNLFVAHGGNNFNYTFDPVALFGAALGGGKLLLEVTGWPERLNCGYIVWRNDGNGAGLIGTGVVSYVQTAVQSAGNVAVSLPSTSTNEILISFTGWHTNDHGWSCYIKNDF